MDIGHCEMHDLCMVFNCHAGILQMHAWSLSHGNGMKECPLWSSLLYSILLYKVGSIYTLGARVSD